MRLHAPLLVIPAAFEGDAFLNPDDGNVLCDLVPLREVVVFFGVLRCGDGVDVADEVVETDYFFVAVEEVEDELARDVGGEGRDFRVRDLFDHFDVGAVE